MAVTNKNLMLKKAREEKTLVVKNKLTLEERRKRDSELVRGRFNYNEVPGATLVFPYRKYKGDPVVSYSFVDGQTYIIPRGVAKHIATSGSYPIHEYQTDASGKPVVRIGRKKRRYSFESLAFYDDDEVTKANSNLYTAENI